MIQDPLFQLLLLLALMVGLVMLAQRCHLPASIAYLVVGMLLSPHTIGPSIDDAIIHQVAEYGIVFLLFTIGLSFTPAQVYALRHTILGLGLGQVALTTLLVMALFMACGISATAAFVIGAVAAQSSTTIISKQLSEQQEENSPPGRLAVSLSVFQDITAVPFIVVIPVLGTAMASEIVTDLGYALVKAAIAMTLVILAGKTLLRPLFQQVASRKSTELFTLSVFLVCLLAAFATGQLGLSMAFGAFLAGMVLGETEFRHQVESSIRPFRDVLLGLFFVSIGMLVEPAAVSSVWPYALAGALLLLLIKTLLVLILVKLKGHDWQFAWRTALILAVGGEFGFALLALSGDVLTPEQTQAMLSMVLLSMLFASLLIKFNQQMAVALSPKISSTSQLADLPVATPENPQVIIAGYGRIGQILGNFLEAQQIAFVAIETDARLVEQVRLAGEPVFYGDAANPEVLQALNIQQATLLLIAHDDLASALTTLRWSKQLNPACRVLIRTRDESQLSQLKVAGADEVVPETLEAGMMMVSQALLTLQIDPKRVAKLIEQQRRARYPLLHQLILPAEDRATELGQLVPVELPQQHPWIGQAINQLPFGPVTVQVLVRNGQRITNPRNDYQLQAGDVLVLFGLPEDLRNVQQYLELTVS